MTDTPITPVLEENIRALERRRVREEQAADPQTRLARRIAEAVGSMPFVYLNAAVFAAWIAANRGWTPITPFDPHLTGLTGLASLEAIFLSIFVLINQRREARAADQRADLDLQVSLLSEHEITRLITLTAAMARRLGVEGGDTPEIKELEKDVAPEAVLDKLDTGRRRKPD